MSILDEMREDFPTTGEGPEQEPVWRAVCVCGHLRVHHPVDQGGTDTAYAAAVNTIEGCFGALGGRGSTPMEFDVEKRTVQRRATCPCREWAAVLEIDRPRLSLFRQRVGARHPLLVGLGAFETSQHNRKDATEESVQQALATRVRWVEGARVCAVCGTTGGGVWPSYVDEERHSEMRCEAHR